MSEPQNDPEADTIDTDDTDFAEKLGFSAPPSPGQDEPEGDETSEQAATDASANDDEGDAEEASEERGTPAGEVDRRAALLEDHDAPPPEGEWDEIESQSARIRELEARLSEHEQALEAAHAGEGTGAVDDTQRLLAARDEERAVLQKKIEELESELQSASIEQGGLQLELERRDAEISGAHSRLRRLETQLRDDARPTGEVESALETQVTGLREALACARREATEREMERAELATEIALARASVEARRRENEQQLERIRELECALARRDEDIEGLREAQRSQQNAANRGSMVCAELRSTLTTLEETLAARDREIAAQQEHLSITRQGLMERDQQIEEIGRQFDQNAQKFAEREAALEEARSETERYRLECAERDQRIAKLSRTLKRVETALRTSPDAGTSAARVDITTESPENDADVRDGCKSQADERLLADSNESDCAPGSDVTQICDASDEVESACAVDDTPPAPSREEALGDASDSSSGDEGCGKTAEGEEGPSDLLAAAPPEMQPIFRYWRDKWIEESATEMGAKSADDFFASRIASRCEMNADRPTHVFSLCGGDSGLEVRLAAALKALGHEDIVFHCLESDPERAALREDLAQCMEVGDAIRNLNATRANWPDSEPCDVLLADGSLSWCRDLDGTLDLVFEACEREAIVVLADHIGNPNRDLSEDALESIERVWQVMPEEYRLDRLSEESAEHFDPAALPLADPQHRERMSALLPALRARFGFGLLAGFGHYIDLFVGPQRGANFDTDEESDREFIERFSEIDQARMSEEGLPPHHLLAELCADSSRSDCVVGFAEESDPRDKNDENEENDESEESEENEDREVDQ